MNFNSWVSWKLDMPSGLWMISLGGTLAQMSHTGPCKLCLGQIWLLQQRERWGEITSLSLWFSLAWYGRKTMVCAAQRSQRERICSLRFFKETFFLFSWRPHYYLQKKPQNLNNPAALMTFQLICLYLTQALGKDTPRKGHPAVAWGVTLCHYPSQTVSPSLCWTDHTGPGLWSWVHSLDSGLNGFLNILVHGQVMEWGRAHRWQMLITASSCLQVASEMPVF